MPGSKNIESRPNFLIVVADDLGFTDLSAFGGEIHTPNLKRLSEKGIRFTDFHTASACSPTRSMLFSGTDNHIAGLGQMAEFAKKLPEKFEGKPGYEGYLNERVAALPEILQDGGYYTFLSGKWHLGLTEEYWPIKRGFEKSFTLLPGAGNHYKYFPRDENGETLKFLPPLYCEDDRRLDADEEIPDDFYSTDYFTERGLGFLDQKYRKGRPFFGCLTYTAPHWPYQAPDELIAKYNGVYDDGPEELRRRRLQAAAKLGIIPDGVEPHPIKTLKKRWKDLLQTEKESQSKIMQTYAAMVEILDVNIGKILDSLEQSGELDNTFVLFMSDNGAEGMFLEALPLSIQRISGFVDKYYDNSFKNIGKKNSFVYYGDQWAQALTSPSSMYKSYNSEGGIRCPLIVHYPPLLNNSAIEGQISHAFTTVMDILPTVLELAGIEHPGTSYKGRTVAKPKGKSWVTHLLNKDSKVHSEDTVTGWELFGQQAIRKGKYKALYISAPQGPDKWQLFDIKSDPGEIHDLSESHPEKLEELLNHWTDYVAETGLVEVGSALFDCEKINEDDTLEFTIIKD